MVPAGGTKGIGGEEKMPLYALQRHQKNYEASSATTKKHLFDMQKEEFFEHYGINKLLTVETRTGIVTMQMPGWHYNIAAGPTKSIK